MDDLGGTFYTMFCLRVTNITLHCYSAILFGLYIYTIHLNIAYWLITPYSTSNTHIFATRFLLNFRQFLRKRNKNFGGIVNQNETCRNVIHYKEKKYIIISLWFSKIEHFQITTYTFTFCIGVHVWYKSSEFFYNIFWLFMIL